MHDVVPLLVLAFSVLAWWSSRRQPARRAAATFPRPFTAPPPVRPAASPPAVAAPAPPRAALRQRLAAVLESELRQRVLSEARAPAAFRSRRLLAPATLRDAVIAAELLGPPLALRER